jgi:GNAT superfamily N-acetyltransferase
MGCAAEARDSWPSRSLVERHTAGPTPPTRARSLIGVPEIGTTDVGEAAALQAAGARLVRHGHDLVLELASVDPPPAWARPTLPGGLRMVGIEEARSRLGAAMFMAYPPGHPDAPGSREESERRAREVLAGGPGPVLEPPSAAIVDTSAETVVGAVVVTRLGAAPWGWGGGPWVAELFVAPAHQGRGLGRALLLRAVAWSHAAGEPRIGLTVTDGNPAERLYARVGFRRRRTLFVLETS